MAAPAILAALVALGLTVSAQAAVSPETVDGFAEITGGGTLRLGIETIRLYGIATAAVGTAVEIEARGWLHRRIASRRIYCHFDPTAALVERARIGQCEIEGLDISALMVEAGMAVDCPATSKGRYKIQQQRAEAAGFNMNERIPLPARCGSGAKKPAKKKS